MFRVAVPVVLIDSAFIMADPFRDPMTITLFALSAFLMVMCTGHQLEGDEVYAIQ